MLITQTYSYTQWPPAVRAKTEDVPEKISRARRVSGVTVRSPVIALGLSFVFCVLAPPENV